MREPTESSRVMRGAGENISEYISELHTKIMDLRVGCDGVSQTLYWEEYRIFGDCSLNPVLTEAQDVSSV